MKPVLSNHNPQIAIVGMSCQYPDAKNPEELWKNVLAKRQAFRRLPQERLALDDYFSNFAHPFLYMFDVTNRKENHTFPTYFL